ncbi:NUDIX domain-containing protein [Nakamurella multipartita]|uniref:NUDIX hydrolase n=1 Tax=Nakamurella multipartita (strain ATCC 700099 / DSM 44233 / CIP 104796 / JCM 9543 / NBRC 105858 / Y-104) TaxID=479431 RepID=C8XHQ0_NAKMY|nr:NUDIX hydrolase [Nakamurella multipartita]ACV80353.1 NUDIX hydrolase [Nakamurella multipartita DSM 44233]
MTPGPAGHDFTVVASTPVYDGKIVSLRVDEVRMPGGGTANREIVGHGGAVSVVALDSTDPQTAHVLLIEQYRHAVGRRLWEMPAGLLDVPGEPAQPAAQRELLEETGYRADSWTELLDVATSPGFSEETVRIFLATGMSFVGRPDGPDDEEAELRVVWVPLRAAVQAALAGSIVNVMAVAGVLAADAVLRGIATPVARPDPAEPDAPWTVYRGAGTPSAPPLDGAREL